MSAKWQAAKQWEREHLRGWLTPVRVVLHALSSIPLAVVLLSLVMVYATLAAVPIGMLALIPTLAIVSLMFVLLAGIGVGLPGLGLWKALGGWSRPARFVVVLVSSLALFAGVVWAWLALIWPALRYDAVTGGGFRLFASFCERYEATTLRRLPGFEMTEGEFYAWWPLRLILLLFVVNMVVATVRRIEFRFRNIGVLTVHTGIVLIALGSALYGRMKVEGDMLLIAGQPDRSGEPTPGPPEDLFYDRARTALWVSGGASWEQRPIDGLPRYNDYWPKEGERGETLRAIFGEASGREDEGRRLSIEIPAGRSGEVGSDVRFRVVGFAAYAEAEHDWRRLTAGEAMPGESLNPVRFLRLHSYLNDPTGRMIRVTPFMPSLPSHRVVNESGVYGMEWTRGMDEARWGSLGVELSGGVHGLVIEIPGTGERIVRVVESSEEFAIGSSGYRASVVQVSPEPPMPIVTAGYRGATSSVAIVRVVPPEGPAFERWVYHRFPEISQDMVESAGGPPQRRAADPSIRIWYVDASQAQIYVDESEDGSARVLVRRPDGSVARYDGVRPGDRFEFLPKLEMEVGEPWEHSRAFERAVSVPDRERQRDLIGTHQKSMVAVEVTSERHPGWSRVVWLPFTKFLNAGLGTEREMSLPDGRRLRLAFGPLWRRLDGFMLQLVDFQMISYDHRGAPRDYRSTVRVIPTDGSFEAFTHVTKLNAPLTAPFLWSEGRSIAGNVIGRLGAGLNPRQYKFSQAGWDRDGWERTQALADAGQRARPMASFTILGVGNNPGIHVIALGGILISAGIPWAFYIKPLLVRREKAVIQRRLAEGTYEPPKRRRAADEARGVLVLGDRSSMEGT